MIVAVESVTKSFGPTTTLMNVSFLVNEREHVGLVGSNGSGKTTLLRIIAGETEPDSGVVRLGRGIEPGYLPQAPPDTRDATIDDIIVAAIGDLRELERVLRRREAQMANASGAELDSALEEYGSATERFDRRGGYDLDYRIDIVLAGLTIAHIARDRQFVTLSGGEKARVLLAALLLQAPDLLLLDEPTNHLDFASAAWLEDYLAEYGGTVLIVSHDRHLLNRSVTRIVELDEFSHGVKEYTGNYDAYRSAKAQERAKWELAYQQQQEEIRELQKIARVSGRQVAHNRPRSDHDKIAHNFFGERVQQAVSRNVRSAEERLRRIEEDPIHRPPQPMPINPTFSSHAFQDRVILDDVLLAIGSHDRLVIVGENGSGKTTLLNVLAGRLTPAAGTVRRSAGARVGYLDQDVASLNPDRTVLEHYTADLVGYAEDFVNELFTYGRFRRDDLTKRVGQLSLGQRRKLQIARLIAERANVLLLDEPTNHLGFDVLEQFEKALVDFPGPIVVVSHDVWFIERFKGTLLELRDCKLRPRPMRPG